MELITADQIVQTPLAPALASLRQSVWRAMPDGVSVVSGAWVLRWVWESELRALLLGRFDLGSVLALTQGAVPARLADIDNHILSDETLAPALVALETQGLSEAMAQMLRRTTTGYSPVQTVQCACAVLILGVAQAHPEVQ